MTTHHAGELATSNLFYRRPELYDQVQADPCHTVARRVEQVVATCAPTARTLLDLGCGTGRDLEVLAARFTCVGVDLQPDLVAYARRVRPQLDIRVGDMRGFRLGTAVDVLTCLGNSLAYIHDDAGLAAVFGTFAAHATTGTLLLIATTTEPIQAASRTHRVDTADLHADVTVSYTWDQDTGFNTMLRRWRMDTGAVHADHIRRRVRSTAELDRHAAAVGFQPVDRAIDRHLLAWHHDGQRPFAVSAAHWSGVGAARRGPFRAASTIPSTSGAPGNCECDTRTEGQTSCNGTFTAPASRAESGGTTVWSSAVHSDSQGRPAGSGWASTRRSNGLSGTNCWHASGHAPGSSAVPAAAMPVPCNGEPSVTTLRARCWPPSRATHRRVTTPPAE